MTNWRKCNIIYQEIFRNKKKEATMENSKDNANNVCKDHNHQDCHCHEHEHCDCESAKHKYKMCVLKEGKPCVNCGACDICDLDPTKICDNCGKCLDQLTTNDKGFVEIPVDKIIMGESEEDELDSLMKLYGLDDDEDDE